MKISKRRANVMLLVVAILWGSSYVLAKLTINAGMESGIINAVRGSLTAIAGLILFNKEIRHMTRADLKFGFLIGTNNFLGYFLQTEALQYTTPAKNAFLTTLYIALAPFLLWLVWHEKPQRKTYIAVPLAVIGMAVITNVFSSRLQMNFGDLLTIVSAIMWALQLIYFSKFGPKVSSPWVIVFMIGICQGIFGWLDALLFERSDFTRINWLHALVPLAILAIVVTFLAQGMQIIAQRYTDTTAAGLLLMLESFFASVMSILMGYDHVTYQLIIGGVILLLANAIMQINFNPSPLTKK